MKRVTGTSVVVSCVWALAMAQTGTARGAEAGAAQVPRQVIRSYSRPLDLAGAPPLRVEARPANGFGAVKAGTAMDAGEFYRASGRKIRLFRSLEKVVVRGQDAAAAIGQVNALGKGEFALEATVPKRGLQILRAGERLTKESLNAVVGLADTDPVYINEETADAMLVTDRFVVRLAPGANRAALNALNGAHGVVVVSQMHGTDREYVCQKPGVKSPENLALCEVYHQDASVDWASPDFIVRLKLHYTPTDPNYSTQWHLHNTGQTGGTPDADVDAPEAWDRPRTLPGGDPNVIIAIIDTGVELDHEDLQSNIYVNQAEAGGDPNLDDDLNGYLNDVNGWDFWDDDATPDPTAAGDPNAHPHGTACAGVAAAVEGNSLGGVGVAFNCKILPIKISSDDGSWTSSAVSGDGIRYAADYAHVLSNSWGWTAGDDPTIHSAIQYAVNTQGKVVLFSTGNSAHGWVRYTISGFLDTNYLFTWEYTKDVSGSAGDDTVWVDDVVFPGGDVEDFEGSFPPSGWHTSGYDANWTQECSSKHALGTGCCSAKAGDIANDQTTVLETTKNVEAGSLVFHVWTSSQSPGDVFTMSVNGVPQVIRSGVPSVTYDVAYPARYAECIAIGASTCFDFRSAYSQYDETLTVLDNVAPSSGRSYLTCGITTTDLMGSNGYEDPNNYTSTFGGTSSAAPLAAGVAALVLSKNFCFSPADLRAVLHDSADEIGCESYPSGYNKYYGYGRLNANAALAATEIPSLLRLEVKKASFGTVLIVPDQLDPVDPNLRRYCYGTVVCLTAIPNPNKGFKWWRVYDPNYPDDANYITEIPNVAICLTIDEGEWRVIAKFKCGGGGVAPLLSVVLVVLGGLAIMRRRRWLGR